MPFALELTPPTRDDALSRRVLGLPLPLRLALTAQSAGAVAIVTGDERVRALLDDARLTIPVVAARPSGTLLWRAPANLMVHRGLFGAARATHETRDWDVVGEPLDFAPPYGFSPIVVEDAASRSRARGALLRSLRKPQDGWTSTLLNRHLSLFVTRFLVATPLRPNQVSVGILFIGLAGAYLATRGDYLSLLLGAVLFQAQSVLDGCDGEMSRLTFRGSRLGEWLDTIGDDLTNYGFFTATGWGLYRHTGSALYLWAGGVVALCGIVTSAIEYRYLVKIGSGDLTKYPIGVGGQDNAEPTLFDRISPIFKRDTFVFLTLIGAALGVLSVVLVVFALGGVGIVLTVFKAELRMARERRAARS